MEAVERLPMAVAAARPRLVHREFRGTNMLIRRTNLINLGVTEKTPFAMREKLHMDDSHAFITHSASRRRFLLAGAAAVAALGALAAAGMLHFTPGKPLPRFEAVDITGATWGKDFALTDHTGKPRALADFRGKVVLLYFGYVNCPDMCPTTMAKLGATVKLLGEASRDVRGLFVTVDPTRDTPKVLAQYVPSFHPLFIGLYGDRQAIEQTAKEFKVYFNAQAPNVSGFYTVDHSGPVYVFDRIGRLRLFIKPDATSESIVNDVRILLEESKG